MSLIQKNRTPKPLIYSTYQQALTNCGSDAYESRDLVEVVIKKNEVFKNSLKRSHRLDLSALRTATALAPLGGQLALRILDFGGGGGQHYRIAKKLMGPRKEIFWNVVETPEMVRSAEKLAEEGLKFFSNIEEAAKDLGQVDLIFANASLHYTPDPLAVLARLLDLKAKHIFITRVPFTEKQESVVSVQTSMLSNNGPGPMPEGIVDREIRYPITFVNRVKVEALLQEKYQIRFSICEEQSVLSAGNQSYDLYGYFCDLKVAPNLL